eukprot:4884326-Prymnesium_polylepis.1
MQRRRGQLQQRRAHVAVGGGLHRTSAEEGEPHATPQHTTLCDAVAAHPSRKLGGIGGRGTVSRNRRCGSEGEGGAAVDIAAAAIRGAVGIGARRVCTQVMLPAAVGQLQCGRQLGERLGQPGHHGQLAADLAVEERAGARARVARAGRSVAERGRRVRAQASCRAPSTEPWPASRGHRGSGRDRSRAAHFHMPRPSCQRAIRSSSSWSMPPSSCAAAFLGRSTRLVSMSMAIAPEGSPAGRPQ